MTFVKFSLLALLDLTFEVSDLKNARKENLVGTNGRTLVLHTALTFVVCA